MRSDLKTMPTDDLWRLYEQIGGLLTEQLTAEKRKLERRLGQLRGDLQPSSVEEQRRPYPKVHPKYQNPDDPSQTWAGRGRTPRWIGESLTAGKSIDELRINENA